MKPFELIPTSPLSGKPRRYSKDTNGLTRQIIDYINENGGFATRVTSTGSYRADKHRWVFSTQIAGMPDIQGVYQGKALYIEIKTGSDRLNEQQRIIKERLEATGALYYLAKDFQGFITWFDSIDNG